MPNHKALDPALHRELEGVAQLGGNELAKYISDNSIAVTQDQLVEIERALTVGGEAGKLFRHNGKVTQYMKSSFSAIPFPTLVREDTEFVYDGVSRGITINRSGWYTIRSTVSMSITGHHRQTSEHAIFLNGVLQEGSRAYGYHRDNRVGKTTVHLQYLLDITEGDVVDVRCRELSRRDQKTLPNACNIMIERA